MTCGHTYFIFKGLSKAAEVVARNVFDASEEDAKDFGDIVGGAVAIAVAAATVDGIGISATAAEISSSEHSL